MKNKNQSISPKKLEMLSRYIDDDLSIDEKTKISTEIEQNELLRIELQKLHGFKHLLSIAPQAKTPRSFRITREMLVKPSFFGLTSKGWQFVSQASFVAILVLMASQVLIPQRNLSQASAPAEFAAAVAEMDFANDIAENVAVAEAGVLMDEPGEEAAPEMADESANMVESFEVEDEVSSEDSNDDLVEEIVVEAEAPLEIPADRQAKSVGIEERVQERRPVHFHHAQVRLGRDP